MSTLTLQQAFELGCQHRRGGKLAEAEQIFRQILSQQPNHPGALHFLGVIAYQVGRLDIAAELMERSIALAPSASFYSNLGEVFRAQKRTDASITAYRQALALDPRLPEAHNNLGNALKEKDLFDEATAAYRQALALNARFPEAHNNLGVVLKEKREFEQAIATFNEAVRLKPDYFDAYTNLASALKGVGRVNDAVNTFRRALQLMPNSAETLSDLGSALKDKGDLEEAVTVLRQAIALKPDLVDAHNNLGNALQILDRVDEAILCYEKAVALNPGYAKAYNNLGSALTKKGMLTESLQAYRRALELTPNLPNSPESLANILQSTGDLDERIHAFQRALAPESDSALTHSNLVFSLHYNPDYDARAIAAELQSWNRLHAQPLHRFILPHSNDRNPERKLRIGYVSPDFRAHPISRFLLPLIANHDRQNFELFCYANVIRPDEITDRFRSLIPSWRNTLGFSDKQVADQIRQDGIDILVDLAMHSASNRLLVFAHKSAPVQVTWLAYCSSTGMETMDYRLSDPYLDSPLDDDSVYAEETVRLPETYWCFVPPTTPPAPSPLPALEKGFITFGSLNNFAKVTVPTLALWGKILNGAPNSRLIVHVSAGEHRERVLRQMEQAEVSPERIEFFNRLATEGYMNLHHRIDIALDPHPYGGGTTTCDSLWMGVPVVSLVGKTAVGRGGLSLLTNVGLPELAARTPEEYVKIALDLAGSLPRLAEIRATLRQRMESSPITDAPRFARNMEAAFREMWRKWCATPLPPG